MQRVSYVEFCINKDTKLTEKQLFQENIGLIFPFPSQQT